MEEWQINFIDDNEVYLYNNTICTTLLLAELGRLKLLTKDQRQRIGIAGTQLQQANTLYDFLKVQRGAYEGLISALKHRDVNLTGAVDKLKEGLKNAPGNQQANNDTPAVVTSVPSLPEAASVVSSSSKKEDVIDVEAILKDYEKYALSKDPITVVVQPPDGDMKKLFENPYDLPYTKKGLAFLLNIKQFDKYDEDDGAEPDNTRHGSEMDITYLTQLFRKFGYDIFKEREISGKKGKWYKRNLKDWIKKFKAECEYKKPKSIIVFIGSHGGHNTIITSDAPKRVENPVTGDFEYPPEQYLRIYEDIVGEFYPKNCKELEDIPKIFLVSACQNFEKIQEDSMKMKPSVKHMLVCTAQVPGFPANRNTGTGTWFIHCLTYVMMKYACKMSLENMLNLTKQMMLNFPEDWAKGANGEKAIAQRPEIRNYELENFYFFMEQG